MACIRPLLQFRERGCRDPPLHHLLWYTHPVEWLRSRVQPFQAQNKRCLRPLVYWNLKFLLITLSKWQLVCWKYKFSHLHYEPHKGRGHIFLEMTVYPAPYPKPNDYLLNGWTKPNRYPTGVGTEKSSVGTQSRIYFLLRQLVKSWSHMITKKRVRV